MNPNAKRILVVDDHDDARAALRALLEFRGHLVEEAENGTRGVMTALAWQPDIICLDLTLPAPSSYDVARLVIAAFGGIHRPLLFAMSGRGDGTEQDKAMAAGFDGYLGKPYETDVLEVALAGGSAPPTARARFTG